MVRSVSRAAVAAAVWLIPLPSFAGQPPAAQPPSDPGVQPLPAGPVHEAFAQPGAEVRGKGMTAPKAPPANVQEVPPDQKPDGANVRWVPGYWHWDAGRDDFVWVSGFWRNAPAGRDWQPGTWAAAAGGTYEYRPGFWKTGLQASRPTVLPEPPASVETGPSTPPPTPDAVWVPGGWVSTGTGYAWRAGYWGQSAAGQVWQPGQYVYSGGGYTYVPGYWDYPLDGRGQLFAPVAFSRPLYAQAGYSYTPRVTLGVGFGTGYGYGGGLFGSLGIGPGYNWYSYGGLGSIGLGFGYGYAYNPFNYLWGTRYALSPWLWGGRGYGYGSGFGVGFGVGYGGYRPGSYVGPGYYNPLWQQHARPNYGFASPGRPWTSNSINPGFPLGGSVGVPYRGPTTTGPRPTGTTFTPRAVPYAHGTAFGPSGQRFTGPTYHPQSFAPTHAGPAYQGHGGGMPHGSFSGGGMPHSGFSGGAHGGGGHGGGGRGGGHR